MLLDEEIIEHHPVIGKRLRPGAKITLTHPEWGDYVLQSNNYGFRASRDYEPKKPAGKKRALVFGDSNVFGNGVSNDQRFPDILETILPGVEVYNFAMEGFAVDQQYLCYQEFGVQFEHDLVIIAPAIETIRKLRTHYEQTLDENNIQRCYARPYFDLVDGKLVRGNIPVPDGFIDPEDLPESEKETVHRGGTFAKIGDMLQKVNLKDVVLRNIRYQPFPEYDQADNPAWQVMRAIILDWVTNSAAPVLLVPLPRFIYVKEQTSPEFYRLRFREVAAEAKCRLYDPLTDLLTSPMEERRKMYFLEGHLTPFGQKHMAEFIAPHVQNALQG
jgi:hypothetical protein